MLSKKAIDQFKKLYVDEFGEEISDEKATEQAVALLTLFNHIYRPVKKDWLAAVSDEEKPNITKL